MLGSDNPGPLRSDPDPVDPDPLKRAVQSCPKSNDASCQPLPNFPGLLREMRRVPGNDIASEKDSNRATRYQVRSQWIPAMMKARYSHPESYAGSDYAN